MFFNQTGIRAVATRRCGHQSNHITIPLTGRGASPRRCAGHRYRGFCRPWSWAQGRRLG
jgi:hypothetical protein